jgi:hypothetical protein
VLLDRNAAGRTIYFLDPASAAGFVARWCTAKKPLRALSGFGMTIGAATKAAVEQNRQATAAATMSGSASIVDRTPSSARHNVGLSPPRARNAGAKVDDRARGPQHVRNRPP